MLVNLKVFSFLMIVFLWKVENSFELSWNKTKLEANLFLVTTNLHNLRVNKNVLRALPWRYDARFILYDGDTQVSTWFLSGRTRQQWKLSQPMSNSKQLLKRCGLGLVYLDYGSTEHPTVYVHCTQYIVSTAHHHTTHTGYSYRALITPPEQLMCSTADSSEYIQPQHLIVTFV